MIQAELDFIHKVAREHYRGGKALDVGSSGAAFRARKKFPYDLAALFKGNLVSFDAKRESGVDVVGDAESLSDYFPPGSMRFVVCTSLLEHVRRPWAVVEEVARVLEVSGVAVFSAPWKYADHPDPIDCWRISVAGMRALAGGWFNEIACKSIRDEVNEITVTVYAGLQNGRTSHTGKLRRDIV